MALGYLGVVGGRVILGRDRYGEDGYGLYPPVGVAATEEVDPSLLLSEN